MRSNKTWLSVLMSVLVVAAGAAQAPHLVRHVANQGWQSRRALGSSDDRCSERTASGPLA
jgi:hypothetical protein